MVICGQARQNEITNLVGRKESEEERKREKEGTVISSRSERTSERDRQRRWPVTTTTTTEPSVSSAQPRTFHLVARACVLSCAFVTLSRECGERTQPTQLAQHSC